MPEAWLTHATIMWVLIVLSVWTFFPFVLVNVLARLQTIPPELYDAARVDGASAVRQFFHVTLPQLRNVLLIVLLLRGIWMFTKFDVPWLLGFGGGAGEAIRTLPVFTYQRSFTYYQAGMGAALSNVMLALLLMAVTIYFVAFPPAGGRQRCVTAAGVSTTGRPPRRWTLRIGLFVFCAFPLYWMLVSSLKVSHELLASPPTFWPHEWELRAYRKLFYETNFWMYFENTRGRRRADDRDRHRGRRDRRLQPDPLRLPRPHAGGARDAAGLHVPAHHHAGPALPAGPPARPGQLAPRAWR